MDDPANHSLAASRWADRRPFAVGPVTVTPATRSFDGPGGRISVEPRIIQVLLQLMDADGEVVTREALFAHCWNGIFVGDDSLNRAIFELRRALRSVAAPITVETIPKTGYRLAGLPARAATGATVPRHRPLFSRRLLVGGAAGLMAVGGAALLEWRNAPTAQARQAANLVERADIVRRDDMADSAERSVGLYRQALALVPDDAATWGKLALALGEIVESATPDQAASAVAATQIAARRGLDLQPGLADARVALAMLLPHFGSWLPVERTLRAILAEAPDNVAARRNLAVLLMEVGRVREGAAIMDRLVEREPLSPDLQYRHVYQLWARGRLREADQVADRSLQLWPRHPAVWLSRVWTFGLTGRTSAALAMINDDAGRPDLPAPLVNLLRINCTALATRTDRDVKAAIAANMAAARQGQFGVVSATLTLPQLGAADVAYQIDRGYLVREGPLVGLLRRPLGEPILSQQNRHTMALWMPSAAPLRAEPGFLSLCADMGMMAYWREGGHWPDFLGNRPPT